MNISFDAVAMLLGMKDMEIFLLQQDVKELRRQLEAVKAAQGDTPTPQAVGERGAGES